MSSVDHFSIEISALIVCLRILFCLIKWLRFHHGRLWLSCEKERVASIPDENVGNVSFLSCGNLGRSSTPAYKQ